MKDIKDYLHLYLGCDIHHEDGTTATLVSASKGWCHFVNNEHNQCGEALAEFIKPILRPLSDMTEDEGIEVCKFIVVEKRQNQIDLQELTSNHIWYTDGEMWYGDGVSEVYDKYIKFNELSADQFRYMLSKGFDLFGLIDAGLAIDKTKQP